MDQSQKQAMNASAASKIFIPNVLELKDPDEERMERGNTALQGVLRGLSEREANDVLNTYVSKGPQQHKEIQMGLLYNILVDQSIAAKCFRDVMLISRDVSSLVNMVTRLAYEKFLRMSEQTRKQVVWLTEELVKNTVEGSDELYLNLLRQIIGGDTSTRNIWLAESMLDIFVDNKLWLERSPSPRDMVATVVYTYLRLIVDHRDSSFSTLRAREVDLCLTLLREKWMECLAIGRDLVRLLQLVARIPEFEKLWRDIFLNPAGLHPEFKGILQMLSLPSKKHILASRLTPDMEKKITFLLLHQVQFGKHKWYQDWFQQKYLSTPESQSLRCDLIRYIVVCVHPTNEQIPKNVPRWAVIGWLLTSCTSNVAASDAKLALFLDWLLFDIKRDSIMNIEPAILVMFNSMKPHPAITATLLDFLCRIMPNFCPRHATAIREGIYNSLEIIVAQNVLCMCTPPAKTLYPLFTNNKLDQELRALIVNSFPEFCISEDGVREEPSITPSVPRERDRPSIDNGNHISDEAEGRFSDDEEESPLIIGEEVPPTPSVKEEPSSLPAPVSLPSSTPSSSSPSSTSRPSSKEKSDLSALIDRLQEPEIRALTTAIHKAKNQEVCCEATDDLMNHITTLDDFEYEEDATILASCLLSIFHDTLNSAAKDGNNLSKESSTNHVKRLFPKDSGDDEAIQESVGSPFFVIFRFLTNMSADCPKTRCLLQLIAEMHQKKPQVGYLLLYFQKINKKTDDTTNVYTNFCKSLEGKEGKDNLKSHLMTDLKVCAENDVRLFTFLIPHVYTQYSDIAVGNTDLIHLIVESIDGNQLKDLICEILQGHLVIFNETEFQSILNVSLEWETIEQFFLWQLISAHSIPVEHLLPVLPTLKHEKNAEALTSLMVRLKQEPPSADLLRPILCREQRRSDHFVVSVLKYWAVQHEDRLADLIKDQLTRPNGTAQHHNKNKRAKTRESKKDQPTMEQVLSHLDHMRQVCRNITFLTHERMQDALQYILQTASDGMKSRFTDLLALAEDPEDSKTKRVLRGRRTTAGNSSPKFSKNKRPVMEESESSPESEDDEVQVRQPPKKKKKISQPQLDDDSD